MALSNEQYRADSAFFGENADFIEQLYHLYTQDHKLVDTSWHNLFENIEENTQNCYLGKFEFSNPQITHQHNHNSNNNSTGSSVHITNLIQAYREYGHTVAKLDPLILDDSSSSLPAHNNTLHHSKHSISDSSLTDSVPTDVIVNHLGKAFASISDLQNLIQKLQLTYCNNIGYEFTYIENQQEKDWIIQQIEGSTNNDIDNTARMRALERMAEIETFERFLHRKFVGAKRFSIEGGESAIAAIEHTIHMMSQDNIDEFVIGMAHRGRLSTLTNIMNKPYHLLFAEFAGKSPFIDVKGISGDVKYHLGTSCDIKINNRSIHLSLTPNPSHLETVNSVALGRAKAKQQKHKKDIATILIHGDASVSGQGSVMESIMMSKLDAYDVGGTIHIVINNRLGFTTDPEKGRFGRYCTDIAKAINAPVIHVNGSKIDDIINAVNIATEYRRVFRKDIFIDIVCYRKYGHNEGDEPRFTQPCIYGEIDKNTQALSLIERYKSHLLQLGILNEDAFNQKISAIKKHLEDEYIKSQSCSYGLDDIIQKGEWNKYTKVFSEDEIMEKCHTGVDKTILLELAKQINSVPETFTTNHKIENLLQSRIAATTSSDNAIDWGTAEALAFASILHENHPIRITGQDVERGTFSHRHAVLIDQITNQPYTPLNHINNKNAAKIFICNSLLSECAVLGFEYGYSTCAPDSLTIWEAQFGDFANGAQVIIDQYITSSESKWLRMSNLIMLLPHGYEGQGPEHSSARLERFLQLSANNNIQVCNCSTPASFFHAIRRQIHASYRKPLIIMTPKSLLRHKLATSGIDELSGSSYFAPVIAQHPNKASSIKRLVFCSGKIYYDLLKEQEQNNRSSILLVRLEQLYPFPDKQIADLIKLYKNSEIMWCQEEHQNMGAYSFIKPLFDNILTKIKHKHPHISYCGRAPSASTATGIQSVHITEQQQIVNEATTL